MGVKPVPLKSLFCQPPPVRFKLQCTAKVLVYTMPSEYQIYTAVTLLKLLPGAIVPSQPGRLPVRTNCPSL